MDARRIYIVLSRTVQRTVVSVIDHDLLNIAQSTAYSAILALFPFLIVAAAVVGMLPDNAPFRFQLLAFLDRVLPSYVSPMLDAYFQNRPSNIHSARALLTSALFSLAGASGVIVTLMEGLRRAQTLPERCWTFWAARRRAVLLVFLLLIPLALASLLVVFGHTVAGWVQPNIDGWVLTAYYAITLVIRWTVTLGANVVLIALLYKLGLPSGSDGGNGRAARRGSRLKMGKATWLKTIPGALVATAMWFLTTLAFGWYVTRLANYSEIYGSLGAGIALLFWLYITSLSVLCGAEFNAHFHSLRHLEAKGEHRKAEEQEFETIANLRVTPPPIPGDPALERSIPKDSPAHIDARR